MNISAKQFSPIKLGTYGAFLAFFLFGFIDNLKGPTLPAILDDLNLNYSLGGTLVLGAYFGFLVATLATGPLSDRVGNKAVVFIACACLALGVWGLSQVNLFFWLMLAMLVIGLGMGALEIGGNAIIVELHQADRGRYLNLLAFFHGLGSMLVPLYAGALLVREVSWRSIYLSSLGLIFILGGYFLFLRYPRQRKDEQGGFDLKALGQSAFSREMILFYICLGLYVSAEIGTGSWLVEFLQQSKGQSVAMSSIFLSLFFGAITLGRFLGSFFVERVGYLKSVVYAILASIICIILGVFGPPVLTFFLPLTGLFFSIVFPTLTAAVAERHQENLGSILGLLFTFGGVGGMLGPWSIGFFSDLFGIQFGFAVILVACIALSLLLQVLIRHGKA